MKVECECPQCGKGHKKRINWTGRGKPKLICNFCRIRGPYYITRQVYEGRA